MEITKALSEYIVKLKFSDLPKDVVEGAKLCFLDWLGVTLSGSKEPLTNILATVAEEQGGKPQATLIGRKKKASLLQAALINGAASHALDFDDVHLGMMGHPSAPVFPAILALGEWKKVSGEQFISAFIAGFEAECRVSSIVYPEHYLCGWHATGTLGHFGAAAACANLLGLNLSQTVYALGIAGTQASGIKQVFGTMCKPFHAGKAAMNGLLSALLAEKGFTSSTDMLEGSKGFSKVFSTRMDPPKALERLGDDYAIRGVVFKRHASCFETHPAIDAVLALKEEQGLTADQVESIQLDAYTVACDIAGIPAPQTGLQGKFSLAFCVALALGEGETGEPQFNDEKVRDPRLVALRDRVKIVPDPNLSPSRAKIRVMTKDGRILERSMETLDLSKDRERMKKDLVRKFQDLSTPILGEEKTKKLISRAKRLDKIGKLKALSNLIKG
ncbi:MAG TPA: MmgE/PrpD family protein [Thermodesulfobacteriota bacterium]|nr:MmgE/PrpD family protein [Thermodesulfobacteriota bacterium]